MDKLPKDLIKLIGLNLSNNDLYKFMLISKKFYKSIDNNFWNRKLFKDYGLKINVYNGQNVYFGIRNHFIDNLEDWENHIRKISGSLVNNYLDFISIKQIIKQCIIDFINYKYDIMKNNIRLDLYYICKNQVKFFDLNFSDFFGPKTKDGIEYDAQDILYNCTEKIYEIVNKNMILSS